MSIGLGAELSNRKDNMKKVTIGQVWSAIDELIQETDFVNKAYEKIARLHGITNQELIGTAKGNYEIPMYLRHRIADGFDVALLNADYKLNYGKVH